ncbi:hypothetical protein AAFF_G00096230 [Aldrovandia affinis]|uniref:Uncharacterized protein n=1 Tax=Aldrovandia affinis TaxID=143900 RepID=A0AAD7RVP0_9TELE|nr:hypothetical protein AAFF_G00096230 [Aldrovandia affinis]
MERPAARRAEDRRKADVSAEKVKSAAMICDVADLTDDPTPRVEVKGGRTAGCPGNGSGCHVGSRRLTCVWGASLPAHGSSAQTAPLAERRNLPRDPPARPTVTHTGGLKAHTARGELTPLPFAPRQGQRDVRSTLYPTFLLPLVADGCVNAHDPPGGPRRIPIATFNEDARDKNANQHGAK